jgi:hypothetical protein
VKFLALIAMILLAGAAIGQLKVKLKAEFQGSNRDMYRTEAIVATSAK